MSDFFTSSSSYQGTSQPTAVVVSPVHQLCAVISLTADNKIQASFWAQKNGERVDIDLGQGSYLIKDKLGNNVSGLSQSGINPDSAGYYHTTPVDASLIYDFTHYLFEMSVVVEGVTLNGSIGLQVAG